MSVVSSMIPSEGDLGSGLLDLHRRNPGDVAGRGIVPGSAKASVALKNRKPGSDARWDTR